MIDLMVFLAVIALLWIADRYPSSDTESHDVDRAVRAEVVKLGDE